MSLLYSIIILTGIGIIVYDLKIQKIPMWLLIINYSSICLVINKWLLFGILFILIAKKLDKPIDLLYVSMMTYLIIIVNSYFSIISILIMFIQVMFTKKTKISFMCSLEVAILIELFIKEIII